jgi:hypothetical protein
MQIRESLGIPDNLRAHTQTKPRNFDPEIVAELEAKKESQIAEQRKQEHQLFVAKFRALMADFLTDTVPESSNHYDAGALARFSKWLGDKQID